MCSSALRFCNSGCIASLSGSALLSAAQPTDRIICALQDTGQQRLCFINQLLQVLFADEAFRVDFIEILGAAGAGGEPAVGGADFNPTDRSAIAGRVEQYRADLFTGQNLGLDMFGAELFKSGFKHGLQNTSRTLLNKFKR